MAYNPDPRLVQAISRFGADLAPLLLATTLVESGGRLDAVGDGGLSIGPYQMHSRGRGYGVPPAKRRDPVFSTQSALAEFRRFQKRGYSGPELAYAAQRPADRSGYIAKIGAVLPEATRILAGAGAAPRSAGAPPVARDPGATASAPGSSSQPQLRRPSIDASQFLQLLNTTAQGALQGQMPSADFGSSLLSLARDVSRAAPTVDQTQRAVGQAVRKAPSGRQGGSRPVPDTPVAPAGKLTPILPGRGSGYSTSGDPEGQSGGHRAVDWFSPHGTPVRAPTSGRVVRITPHSGPVSGRLQVFGGTLSIRGADGRLYVMRHIDPLKFGVGDQIRAGQHVGTPTAWGGTSSKNHIHFEIYPPGGSDREYSTRALNPADFF